MKNIAKLMLLLPIGITAPVQAGTSFTEGARDTVTIHPSCRTEDTGLTAIGVVLPNGPDIKVTIGSGDSKTTSVMTLPYPDALISKDRKGNISDANPIMGASPSFNQAAIFGTDVMKATVAAYGKKKTTEDSKMIFWKLKGVNAYDAATDKLISMPYVPAGGFITVEMGFSLPRFTPTSCLKTLKARGKQIARCDQVDSTSHTIVANSEADIREKRMRLTINRDLVKNPLPEHCGKGLEVTIEATDAEVEALKAKMAAMK